MPDKGKCAHTVIPDEPAQCTVSVFSIIFWEDRNWNDGGGGNDNNDDDEDGRDTDHPSFLNVPPQAF